MTHRKTETQSDTEFPAKTEQPECYKAYTVLRNGKDFVTHDGWTLEHTGTLLNPVQQGLKATKGKRQHLYKGYWCSETIARCLQQLRAGDIE